MKIEFKRCQLEMLAYHSRWRAWAQDLFEYLLKYHKFLFVNMNDTVGFCQTWLFLCSSLVFFYETMQNVYDAHFKRQKSFASRGFIDVRWEGYRESAAGTFDSGIGAILGKLRTGMETGAKKGRKKWQNRTEMNYNLIII